MKESTSQAMTTEQRIEFLEMYQNKVIVPYHNKLTQQNQGSLGARERTIEFQDNYIQQNQKYRLNK